MDTTTNHPLHVCGCCKKELPYEAFYINKKTLCPDNYCKECRKASSRGQYGSSKRMKTKQTVRCYPVITQVEDPAIRQTLILRALALVAQSMKRKKEKVWEELDNKVII